MTKSILIAALLTASLAAQTPPPERKVSGNVIVSDRDPGVRIDLPQSVQYAGADRWVLFGIADCELHAFVVADAQKQVHQLYWVQFEQYVPTRPELHHTYDSSRHATIAGLDFYVDTWARSSKQNIERGSDREHIEALLRARHYQMPAGMAYVRLVHLPDTDKRKELMIIYGEDLNPTGLAAADLGPNGKSHDRWAAIEQALIARAEKQIHLETLP